MTTIDRRLADRPFQKRFWLILLCTFFTASANTAQLRTGEPAPPLVLPVLNAPVGRSLSLESLHGKVVYLDFWASWCGPCRISFPLLDQLRREFSPSGFEVLAVNVDEFKQDALAFLEKYPVSYPVVRDATGDTPGNYGILGMPTGFLLDRHGVVRLVHQGFRKSDIEHLRTQVFQLLEESP